MDSSTPYIRSFARWFVKTLGRVAYRQKFRGAYVVFSLLVLFGTTLLWAALGARLHQGNADQLSDPYLFTNLHTFHGAQFPSSHTFLLKWPIFWLLAVTGITSTSLLVATVGVVLLAVGTLTLVLYKIDRRPLVFGTLALGLSLILLLVPAQPSDGALLPANMAMLTTRNVEYAVYLLALVLFAKARRFRDWQTPAGILLLALLITSDKLFLGLSLGGALLMLVVYAAMRIWALLAFAVRWIAGSVIAALLSAIVLAVISAEHFTHIVSSGPSSSPYNFISDAQNLVLGFIYGLLGFFTNLGANPAYGNNQLRKLPGDLLHGFWSLYGPAYALAAVVLCYVLLLAWRVIWSAPRKERYAKAPAANLLALALIWSTVAAFGLFVATNHYYPVDSRYLTIGLFALAVAAAVEMRQYAFAHPERLLLAASALVAGVVLAAFASVHVYNKQKAALSDINSRDTHIAQLLEQHKVHTLVGNYWRVLPVKLAMQGRVNTLSLADCTTPTSSLTSTAWQPNLRKTNFAYLLTITRGVADFPACSINQIVQAYGRPNATQVITGTLSNPTEMLFFYDGGAKSSVSHKLAAPTTILPITTDQLNTACVGSSTVMNVVAHEDDDLLFLSPDLLHEVKAGECVRTVYITAGDDGQGQNYWLGRQQGSEAAYNAMLGANMVWAERTVILAKDEYVTVTNPVGNHKISLIFFHLPDGNMGGGGFASSGFESLAKLRAGQLPLLRTVDGQSSYTSAQLVRALAQLMELYHPGLIHTQADIGGGKYPDHSDHVATSKFTQAAATVYDQEQFVGAVKTPLSRYLDYVTQGMPANVTDGDLAQKATAFYAYGVHDTGTCTNAINCHGSTYELYLPKQYLEP